MKIVLHAFGDKLVGVMEVPEDTGVRFRLAMTQPIQVFDSGSSKHELLSQPINKIGTFEWAGKIYSQKSHPYDGGRIYQLIDIN